MTTKRGGLILVLAIILLLLAGARTLAGWVLDYQWWKELGQVPTWFSMMLYGVGPSAACFVIAFVVYWIAHARGMKSGGTGLGEQPLYAKLSIIGILIAAAIFASAVVDSWTVVRYFGGRGVGSGDSSWRDPLFGHPLSFYLFELPFYRDLLKTLLALSLTAALVHWVTSRGWRAFLNLERGDQRMVINISNAEVSEAFESRFFRVLVTVFLIALATWFYFDRYELLMVDHGFMVGADWTAEHVQLPLVWLSIAASLVAAVFVWMGRLKLAAAMVIAPILAAVVPQAVTTIYVKPNEIAIQKPYIGRHIEATRSAYGLSQRISERDFPAQAAGRIDVAKNRVLLDNIRLWDWRAFHDTVSQIQPLRPYTFSDTDVDRYTIGGQIRQVLVSPREIDLSQLGDARTRWTNPHLVYTHGYGLVMAEANRIDANGLPLLWIRNAPAEVLTPSLKLTRPELYFGEEIHEPVFVNTDQLEFNYPSGSENTHSKYAGKGGFPISSLPLRFAAALVYGDWNILLTSQLKDNSRMMIHRSVVERLHTLAGFVDWDVDPYLVVGEDGRLVWMLDGYLTSSAHPYSRAVTIERVGTFNYIRNSVKATIDAYDGSTKIYVFDPGDPLISAYRNLFPALFSPASEMPPDLRRHARYPEQYFRAQAEIYRIFHMRDPEAFYNKADMWDVARWVQGQESRPQPLAPTYVVATIPGDDKPEFMLMIPFTPRSKDNLIGLMMARCDGDKLGEMDVLLLSKQDVLLGPMQIEARINQDQNISKDLTLWNQQGSQVLRGQMLVLPVDGTFLYVEPIYIQAKEARMPQLKKVVVALGNSLIYTDTYDQALAQLGSGGATQATTAATTTSTTAGAEQAPAKAGAAAVPAVAEQGDRRIILIRDHLSKYKELVSKGKLAEAGRELEAIDQLVMK